MSCTKSDFYTSKQSELQETTASFMLTPVDHLLTFMRKMAAAVSFQPAGVVVLPLVDVSLLFQPKFLK